MNDENPAYFSIVEFAKKVNVHPNTIRNAIRSGRLHAFRINNGKNAAFRIPVSELERLAYFSMKNYVDQLVDIKLGIK